jgi:DNA repair exonuclease SbcCD ATPase subunit
MALKAILDTLDGLSEHIAALYKKGEDGKFHLDLEGGDDNNDLERVRAKKAEAEKHRKEAEKKAKDLADKLAEMEAQLEELRTGESRKKGDVDALEKSYKEKITKLENDYKAQLQARDASLQTLLVDNVATSLAAKISTKPNVILPHIRSRLRVETVDGKPTTRVLDKDGQLSALTLEELEKDFLASDDFAPIIVGSKAKGSGAAGRLPGGGATKKLSDMTATEEARFANEHPEDYKRMLEQETAPTK